LSSSKSEPGNAEGALAAFQQVGAAIRLLREERGVSLRRLAELSSSGRSQLSKYENGKELPRLDSLARVLDALGVEPLKFFYLAGRLSRGVSDAEIGEEMLRAEARRSPGSQTFKKLLDAVIEAHTAYIETGMGLRLPFSEGDGGDKERENRGSKIACPIGRVASRDSQGDRQLRAIGRVSGDRTQGS
jgi:transcriptional regulator with XRE-family HTH domain